MFDKEMKLDPNQIYKVFHQIWYRNKSEGIFITDLQFDEGGLVSGLLLDHES